MARGPHSFPSCSKLQLKKNFFHFEEWQDKFRRYCISETANLLNKEKKLKGGGNLNPDRREICFQNMFLLYKKYDRVYTPGLIQK